MEEKTDILGLLDLMTRPGFCVKDNLIVKANAAARSLLIEPGSEIQQLVQRDWDELQALDQGCLCLSLSLPGGETQGSVTRMGEYLVFVLEQDSDDAVFSAMALTARELRKPLDTLMQLTDQLLSSPDEETRAQTARLNRGLYQLLRIVGNLSYPASGMSLQEVQDVSGIVDEVMEKATNLLSGRNIHLTYEGLSRSIYCLVDRDLLERALLNLLSNAVKFTPEGGHIQVSLALRNRTLRLQVQDSGSGMAEQAKQDLFYRYLRQPGIEDNRFGLGLGMVLIRSCAAKHGGVVLTDKSELGGSRITMTLSIRQNPSDCLHSPMHLHLDYAGGRDHALVELSDCLDAECYGNTK